MNYYDARKVAAPGAPEVWHYTSQNRRSGTHAVGYCASTTACACVTFETGYRAQPDCEQCHGTGGIPNPDHCGGHATPAEARECFRRYLLDDVSEETYGDWTGCEVCDTPTKKGLTTRRPLGHGHALCDEHRTPEQLADLTPPVGQITASY